MISDLWKRLFRRRASIASLQEQRIGRVRNCIEKVMPQLSEQFRAVQVAEEAVWNFYNLPDGSKPRFTFSIPALGLYFIIGGIETASWEEARRHGVSRSAWQKAQDDIGCHQASFKAFRDQWGAPLTLFHFDWGDPIEPMSLVDRVLGTLKGEGK